jgi:hypothetical protein
MRYLGKGRRNLFGVAVAVGLALGIGLASPAWANAPNPETTTIEQVVVNSNGSTTVTVQGTWTWATQPKCSTARNGVGYQVDWFDNQVNAIGTAADPNGVLYVGDARDNIVHSVETLGGSNAFGSAFYDGVPSSYISHLSTTGTTPTATDAKNWFSQCPNVNSSGVTAGSWGPITHTYAPGATKPLRLCPIMYDPHGGHDNSGQSSMQDITAGGNAATKNYNGDNSYQTNQTGPGPGFCPTVFIPSLTTSASSAQAPGSIHDTATLSHTGGQSGSITFNLYPASANCSGTPLYTNTVSTTGDGDYGSGDFAPGQGAYQWQASYSSSTVKHLITPCDDPNEQSSVTPPTKPKMSVLKLASVPCSDLASTGVSQPPGVLPCTGSSTIFTPGTITVEVPKTGGYAIPITYQIRVTNSGRAPLTLSLNDPLCDPGTVQGPFLVSGGLVGTTLAAHSAAYYTCTHILKPSDGANRFAPFTNTATVTGTPPTGPPIHGRSSVTTKRVHPAAFRSCRSLRTGRKVRWPRGTRKPRACRSQRGRNGHGFTG